MTGQSWANATSMENVYNNLLRLQLSQKSIYEFSAFMNLFFNSIVFIDLYLTIKNPFYPREHRSKFYWLLTLIIFLSFSISYKIFDPQGPGLNYDYRYIYKDASGIMSLITILVTLLVLKRLN